MSISTLIKRDFSKRPFKLEKITSAILKAMQSVNNGDEEYCKFNFRKSL